MIDLGQLGLWTYQLDMHPAPTARAAAAEIERLGFRAIWIPDALRRDVIGNAWLLLGATQQLTIATGIANIYSRDPTAMRLAQMTLGESFPQRFVLGLGVSHRSIVENKRGHQYGPPLTTMRNYLEAMADVPYAGTPPSDDCPVVLAALGPKMIELAREKAAGIHPYHTTPEHTGRARAILGDGPYLAPEQPVVLDTDLNRARHIARHRLSNTFSHPNYQANLRRLGFADDDFVEGGSDRLIDALVAFGGPEVILERVRAHLDAGADHVAIQLMTADESRLPMVEWRALAEAAGRQGLM